MSEIDQAAVRAEIARRWLDACEDLIACDVRRDPEWTPAELVRCLPPARRRRGPRGLAAGP
jgi:hypothetical protein